MLTPAQCRAARALLDWTRDDLAAASGANASAIGNYERGDTDPRGSTLVKMELALTGAGIVLIENGVQLTEAKPQ